jgi:hypothetical protein
MLIPVASRSSDLATAEPSEWPTRIGDLHRCDEREYVPQNALVTDPNAVSLNAGVASPRRTTAAHAERSLLVACDHRRTAPGCHAPLRYGHAFGDTERQ